MDDAKRFQQAKEIFFAAIDLPKNQQNDFIAEQCTNDKELLVEIRTIWNSYEKAENFIETPALESVGKFILDEPNTKFDGGQIGAYRIVREIGRGGMGAVYLAERVEGFQKRVAVICAARLYPKIIG